MLRTCFNAECRKLFSTSGLDTLCPKCVKQEEEYFTAVKTFLTENTGATISEIHEATEIPLDFIDTLYKSGRLSMVVLQKCNRCGDSIKDNPNNLTVCQPCAKAMQNEFSAELLGIKPPPPPPSSARPRSRDDGKSYGLGGSR